MVSFQLTDEQKMMKNTMSDFVEEKIRPIARECDESGSIPDEIVKKFWEIGVVQDIIPEEFGGLGGERSILTSSIILNSRVGVWKLQAKKGVFTSFLRK